MRKTLWIGCIFALALPTQTWAQRRSLAPAIKGWKKGVGWGWVWGKNDEVGSLNAMTDASKAAALRLAESGKTYDLGIVYDRSSFKWPGHSPGEIMTFRSPEGVKRQRDTPVAQAADGAAWHSCALFISDNVATQIDGLGHITVGSDNHWYNGFTEAQWGGNFGIRKCGAETIPPIITRGVLIDVAAAKKVKALPSHYGITVNDLKEALAVEGVSLHSGDTVLIRTGTLAFWGPNGANHELLAKHDSAGLTLEGAKWLIEEHGAIMIGGDTSGVEQSPESVPDGNFFPVHKYLLVEQGVHIAEFHYLEEVSRDGVYEFCYMATTNKIRGAAAGFTMRPIALR